MSVYLGRQPILDARRRRRGYELLFRSGDHTAAFFADPEDATRTVVERALLEWGLENLTAGSPAFINVTAEFLQGGLYTVLPADQVVLELLETIRFDRSTTAAVRDAVRLGYRFAIDDLVSMDVTGLADILPIVDIVKVEVLSLDDEQIRRLVLDVRSLAPRAVLLAEKVETIDSFEFCRQLGFDLFQGYFFARPEVMRRAARPISQQTALVLMSAVQDPDITIDRLAELANADPTLTYRLLKLVNASSSGLATTIDSVHRAIVLLGIEYVCQLATLLTLATNSSDNRELITLAVARAHTARQLLSGQSCASSGFTAGLLSVIDVVFRTPMVELIDDLPITDEVRSALLESLGPVGEVLDLIRAHERADIPALERSGRYPMATIRMAAGHAAASAARLDVQLDALTMSHS